MQIVCVLRGIQLRLGCLTFCQCWKDVCNFSTLCTGLNMFSLYYDVLFRKVKFEVSMMLLRHPSFIVLSFTFGRHVTWGSLSHCVN